MNAHHVKYTVEFDIPIKIDGYKMNEMAYELMNQLMLHSVKVQRFYFNKKGCPNHSIKAKNIKVSYTTEIKDVEIMNYIPFKKPKETTQENL